MSFELNRPQVAAVSGNTNTFQIDVFLWLFALIRTKSFIILKLFSPKRFNSIASHLFLRKNAFGIVSMAGGATVECVCVCRITQSDGGAYKELVSRTVKL